MADALRALPNNGKGPTCTPIVDTLGRRRKNAAMAEACPAKPVKLICGMISASRELFASADKRLADAVGSVEIASEVWDFDFTDYYDGQMGCPLLRRFVALAGLVQPDKLIEAKLLTNEIEAEFARGKTFGVDRPINLDPGYVAESKLVLASMKDFSHRIYLGSGVYAEITLMYRKGNWESLDWTFPDYASGRYDSFLTEARQSLRLESGKEHRK